MVGSSAGGTRHEQKAAERRRVTLTRDDGEFAPEIGQANLGDVQPVNEDPALRRFHKTEERERQSALPRSSATQNTDFLTRANLKRELVEHVGQVGLSNRSADTGRSGSAFQKLPRR